MDDWETEVKGFSFEKEEEKLQGLFYTTEDFAPRGAFLDAEEESVLLMVLLLLVRRIGYTQIYFTNGYTLFERRFCLTF